MGGKVLLIDEIHKYENWSREIKEIYDLYKGLKRYPQRIITDSIK